MIILLHFFVMLSLKKLSTLKCSLYIQYRTNIKNPTLFLSYFWYSPFFLSFAQFNSFQLCKTTLYKFAFLYFFTFTISFLFLYNYKSAQFLTVVIFCYKLFKHSKKHQYVKNWCYLLIFNFSHNNADSQRCYCALHNTVNLLI